MGGGVAGCKGGDKYSNGSGAAPIPPFSFLGSSDMCVQKLFMHDKQPPPPPLRMKGTFYFIIHLVTFYWLVYFLDTNISQFSGQNKHLKVPKCENFHSTDFFLFFHHKASMGRRL